MSAILTKPLIVPEYNNGLIKLYTPNPTTGEPIVNPSYTINLQTVLNTLFPGQGREAKPNCCKLRGVDLYVSQSSGNSQAIIKFPGYLSNPATAQTQAFVFTLDGNDYVGLTFDQAGNLYVAEGNFLNNQIIRYGGTNVGYPGAAAASNNNYSAKRVIGNAGLTSYFANLAFDSSGNLWVSDYQNHRVVAFDAVGLGSGANSYHILTNPSVALAVANTVAGLTTPATRLFAQPEGLDFDSFANNANLWVANNNDGSNGVSSALTGLVKITKVLQNAVLATASGGTITPIVADANTKLFIYQVPNDAAGRPQFGGLQVDKAAGRLYVNEQVGGNGRAYDLNAIATTPAIATNSLLNMVSTNPGNGGITLLELGAFVANSTADKGFEPDTTSSSSWESLALSLTQANGGALATLPPSENVRGGQSCYLYVEVRNFGATPTLGIEKLDLRWAKASAGLGWPKPWDGTIFDAAPFNTSAMGGTIQTGVAIPVILAFGSVVVGPVQWSNAPDPSKYTIQDGHFCLLARIVTPGLGVDGMSYPENNNLIANVLNNARIAWRNIHIINPVTMMLKDRAGVMIANYTDTSMTARVAFEVLDPEGQSIQVPEGSVLIRVSGTSLEALRRSSLGEVIQGEQPVALPNLEAGIDNLPLAPGEAVTFVVDYKPVNVLGYTIRVSQFAKEADGERLVGGQTFVNGPVKGFPIQPSVSEDEPPTDIRIPKGFWWLLVLVLALLILYFVS